MQKFIKLFFYFVLFTQGWIILSGLFNLPFWWVIIASYIGFLAYLYPLQVLYFLLIVMPIFGSRPPDTQAHFLYFLAATIIIGLYSNLYKNERLCKRFWTKIIEPNAITLFVALFAVVSLLSLIGLPILGAIKHSITEDPLYIIKQLLPVGETTLFYSISSQIFLFQAMLIGLYIYGITKPSNQLQIFKNILLSLVAGWFLVIVFGYLDFFGIFELSHFRPDDTATRFVSFFPNSTWTAQYLSLMMPLLAVILLYVRKTWYAIVTLVLLLIIGEVGLILAMERGAWITYPPILFIIWVMVYYIFAKTKDPFIELKTFLRKYWLKVFITIPLTVSLSVLIVYGIKHINQQNFAKSIIQATSKAKRITQANDRLKHWPPAFKLYSENPLFGGGGDSFGWQYKVYYYQKDAKWHDDKTNTLSLGQFGTAHNIYLETLVGKGIFGLIFLIALFFSLFYKLIKKELTQPQLEVSIIGLIIFASLLAAFIYGNVQVITYTQPVAIIFWLMVFMAAGLTHSYSFTPAIRIRFAQILRYTILLMLLLLPFHIANISFIKDFVIAKFTQVFPALQQHSSLIISTAIWLSALGVLISFLMHRHVIRQSLSQGFLVDELTDKPQLFHEAPTPRAGGIGIYLTNLLAIFNPIGWKFLLASFPAFFAGLMDDFSSIPPKVRLVFQVISASLAVFLLNAVIDSIGFGIQIPYWLGAVLSIIAITGVINAINIIDGFNGLAGGFSLLAFLSLGYVAFKVDDMALLELIIINIAALIGFLALNFPRGKIFLGDGGAFFLGFALATIALLIYHMHPKEVSQWYPLGLLIYPVFEVLFSIYRKKYLRETSPFLPDRLHFHMLVNKRITRNNPHTSLYILKRVAIFTLFATMFYWYDLAQILIILIFCLLYIRLYKKIVLFYYN
ncbi:O-antigen ligase family protein [Nitratiruptor tergarcus]|uniref:UDP-N-acetylmuramyl pentapeptide phosphotransferase/UDP-N-acetylglucosamine-1-phosphate transferase n=1 Tax=Nitratiruptor tergarcus DSM 16512 TaxID=1069081 RepID=A0A1W1WTJ4_9BACT|nr:O-antigen ligase family protein [Nitratiruptor tergarcus]SMC09505.1 UDP-N-acetylmuramyl pentapeptide phosphotransferase/UDP-N-acetylglucosamine-1-phosphate transferase [Nitratiruptor tergarcus DSM 16512]